MQLERAPDQSRGTGRTSSPKKEAAPSPEFSSKLEALGALIGDDATFANSKNEIVDRFTKLVLDEAVAQGKLEQGATNWILGAGGTDPMRDGKRAQVRRMVEERINLVRRGTFDIKKAAEFAMTLAVNMVNTGWRLARNRAEGYGKAA